MTRKSNAWSQETNSEWLAALFVKHKSRSRRRTVAVMLVRAVILVLFIGLWEVAGRNKWIDPLLFSFPSRIGNLLLDMIRDGSIWPHVGMTVGETVVGFVLGTLIGTLIAALLWWFPFVSRVLDPYLVVLNSMPKVALGPIFIVALGPGFTSIVVTTLSVTVIITTLNIYNQFREVEEGLVKVVRLFGASRLQTFWYVIIPASFPVIISTLKVNVGLSWVGVMVGEFLVAKLGLGYLIIYGFQVFNFTLVLASLVIIAIVATVMYQLVTLLERRLTGGRRER
ncbi:NitT/TauT family transport system permease protein [Paenibacillus cellulosilyticus]|uniref:NitT/TauT family transport system permease protein n=1 Tax=Paenibacillus cellulosilyticus TaxID=375489 RepID=A0A2V2YRL5_9BACL|nr:ABC transporter permease [Paenibacillus cellulosilyticus]PWW00652.1 NitT/TauT family transport system permease protein [Paenibacillus cellulosilyticus]QKS45518.1 ABC transporter permease [Paenibacillus cellulosilyticus]